MSDLQAIYEALCAPMATFDKQGMLYITGEQCIRRLNEVLGVNAWDFEVKRIWFDREADCVLCLGRLLVRWPDGSSTVHEDIGSQIPNRKRDGSFVELGSDFKGARTDCLKRCAADIGVALWLYHKPEPGESAQQPARNVHQRAPVGSQAAQRNGAGDEAGKAPGKPGATPGGTGSHSAPSQTSTTAPASAPAPPAAATTPASNSPDDALRAAWAEWQALMTKLDRFGVEHGVPHADATLTELQRGIAKYRPLADQAERDYAATAEELNTL